jgi:hypothetical protein
MVAMENYTYTEEKSRPSDIFISSTNEGEWLHVIIMWSVKLCAERACKRFWLDWEP